jgi:hypothetical protein
MVILSQNPLQSKKNKRAEISNRSCPNIALKRFHSFAIWAENSKHINIHIDKEKHSPILSLC